MMSFTIEQLQPNLDQAIDFMKTSRPLTITQDCQPMAMLLSFKEGSELLRLRHVVRLEGYFCYTVKESPTGRVRAVNGRHEQACS